MPTTPVKKDQKPRTDRFEVKPYPMSKLVYVRDVTLPGRGLVTVVDIEDAEELGKKLMDGVRRLRRL